MKCDFCSAPEVGWQYPARNFVGYAFGSVVGESVGDWAACEICHQLIESGDTQALTERSMSMLVEAQPELAEHQLALTAEMTRLHQRFFENRLGVALAVPAASDRQSPYRRV